eukprot:770364-Amorphochlora_amoeboformis.AAC.2
MNNENGENGRPTFFGDEGHEESAQGEGNIHHITCMQSLPPVIANNQPPKMYAKPSDHNPQPTTTQPNDEFRSLRFGANNQNACKASQHNPNPRKKDGC